MADNKIDEAYIELRVDGLDVVKKILDQAKQTTQVFNSTLGETQSWIDRISGQMAGLKSSVQGGLSEPLDKLQRAAQQAKNLTATMGTGAVPLSAKPVPQAPTQRMNDLLDEAMGFKVSRDNPLLDEAMSGRDEFDPFAGAIEYKSEVKAKPQEREVTARQQAVAVVAELQRQEQERIDTIRELTALNQELAGTDDRASAAISKHIASLQREQQAYEDASKPQANFLQNIVSNIRGKFSAANQAVQGFNAASSGGAMARIAAAANVAKASMAALSSVVAPVAAGMAALNAVLIAAPAAFVGAAYAISKFTDALNPGLTMQLNMAMRDLTAVVGTALNPVLQAMVPAIRDFANRLLPITRDAGQYFSGLMQYMRPVMTAFNSMYQQIAGTLAPVFKLVTDIFGILAQVAGALMETIAGVLIPFKVAFEAIYGILRPFIEGFRITGDLLVNIARNFRLFMGGLEGLVKGIASALGLGDMIQWLVDGIKSIGLALKKFTNWLILAAASVAKFFGMTSFVTGMINSLKPADSTGLAAAQNPQYQSIEGLGKNMALQAAIATAGVGEESEQQKLDQQMLESLQSIQKNGPNLIDAINNLPGKIADALGKGAYNANPLKEPGEWLGDKVASWIYG